VKPRIFIGSSTEAKDIADAINTNLLNDAECTVWTNGVFGLSSYTLEGLMNRVRNSDFGIFVFSPDDTVQIRGKLFDIPRDNVVYELGLFSGVLEPQRCFVVTPLEADIRILTDLLGMTFGRYETNRSDGEWGLAVNPFCAEVRKAIKKVGGLSSSVDQHLRDLAVKYECCDWVTFSDPRVSKDIMAVRVAKRTEIFCEMLSFCQKNPVNKRRLLQESTVGFHVAMAAAISTKPADDDETFVLAIDSQTLPKGFAQHVMVDAILVLKKNGKLGNGKLGSLITWVDHMRDREPSLDPKIAQLKLQ
jgi:hypothetical protein